MAQVSILCLLLSVFFEVIILVHQFWECDRTACKCTSRRLAVECFLPVANEVGPAAKSISYLIDIDLPQRHGIMLGLSIKIYIFYLRLAISILCLG